MKALDYLYSTSWTFNLITEMQIKLYYQTI